MHLCNGVTSLASAVEVVERIGSPWIQSIFEIHNAVQESETPGQLIARYKKHLLQVHMNEPDGRHPGAGNYDFAAVLGTLRASGYHKWVSVEVFGFTPGGERIASESIARLRADEGRI